MAEYIEKEAFKRELFKVVITDDLYGMGVASGINIAVEKLNATPAADVVEVKHGHWKLLIFKGGRRSGQAEAKCSICGRDAVYQITEEKWEFENYCPHCGAKMDGGNNA